MRVGLSVNEPWTALQNGNPGGIEVDLIKAFAGELEAEIEWVPGAESELLSALEEQGLDLVVGGLTRRTPWRDRIGTTRPYIQTRIVVAMPAAVTAPKRLSGLDIAVEGGSHIAALVREEDALALASREFPGSAVAVAGYEAALACRGLLPVKHLDTEEHILAVAPGESAFLLRLDRFLASRKRHALAQFCPPATRVSRE